MARMRAIRNHILFQFIDSISNGKFVEATNWGFEIGQNDDSSGKTCRHVVITHIGPEVSDNITVGDTAVVENLKWTEAFKFEGEDYWRTDSDQILMIIS